MVIQKAIGMGFLILTLNGCVNNAADSTAQPGHEIGTPQAGVYEAFVRKIQSENLDEYGVDLDSMLREHLSAPEIAPYLSTNDITKIDYILERCNFSQKDTLSYDDMIIRIDTGKRGPDNASSFYMTVVFAFVLNGNGQLDIVLDETVTGISAASYEVMDVTGDGRDEIILKRVLGRQTGSQYLITILSWRAEQNIMASIFDEKLFCYPVHPYTCQNRYQFVPAQAGGYDIIFYSMFYYMQDNIFETGSTRFVYDGNQYVVNGTYYDYQTRGEAIAEDVRRSKSQ